MCPQIFHQSIIHSLRDRALALSLSLSLSLPILSLFLHPRNSSLVCEKGESSSSRFSTSIISISFHFSGFSSFCLKLSSITGSWIFIFFLHNCCWIWCFDHTLDFSYCVSCFVNYTFPIWQVIFFWVVISFVLD